MIKSTNTKQYRTADQLKVDFLCRLLAFVRLIVGESKNAVISETVQELYDFDDCLSFRLEIGKKSRLRVWFHPDRPYSGMLAPLLVLDATWTDRIREPNSYFLEGSGWRWKMVRDFSRWRSILARTEGTGPMPSSPRSDKVSAQAVAEDADEKTVKGGWLGALL